MVEIGVDENRLSLILPGIMGGGREAAEPTLQETRNDPAMQGIPGQGALTENRSNVEPMRQRPVKNEFDPADPQTWTKSRAIPPVHAGRAKNSNTATAA